MRGVLTPTEQKKIAYLISLRFLTCGIGSCAFIFLSEIIRLIIGTGEYESVAILRLCRGMCIIHVWSYDDAPFLIVVCKLTGGMRCAFT